MENIAKRERSTNFNKSEVRLLTELVAKHRSIIENKQTDAVTNKEKEAAWNKISLLFNAATGFTARSTKSLKLKYESVKKETKKTMAKHRQELYKTSGGPSSAPDFTDIEEKVMAICSNITGLDARNDSDKIPETKLKETVKVIPEALSLQTLENNIVVVPCDDYNPCILGEVYHSILIIFILCPLIIKQCVFNPCLLNQIDCGFDFYSKPRFMNRHKDS
ncbi:uncharacterized protein LOC123698516 [Colias croceus]|uniref:uncharacterized protein LOC123698516 n=1 Tax=Colias crocea TaxID=72248 RepID=UPI001E27AE29|nr:uncharacterized protein LOC123698516 [Colias croceus]